MGPPSYILPVVDRNVVLRCMTVLKDAALKARKHFSGKVIHEGSSVFTF